MKAKTLTRNIPKLGERLTKTVNPSSWKSPDQPNIYNYRWQKERLVWLREHPFCEFCLRDAGIRTRDKEQVYTELMEKGIPVSHGTVVDHIRPHRGDQTLFWDKRNWQTLCKHHHDSEKQKLEK